MAKNLCLECGLCCSGKVFEEMTVNLKESKYFKSANLIATDTSSKYRVKFPCNNLQEGNKCSIYRNRPQVCIDYKCGVLKAYENGEMHWDTALNIIKAVKIKPSILKNKFRVSIVEKWYKEYCEDSKEK